MNNNSTAHKCPRKLVVLFGMWSKLLVEADHGEYPQLVHRQYRIEQPSRLVRFSVHLGLVKADKVVLEAVEKAYRFITSNYAPGDQVMSVSDLSSGIWVVNVVTASLAVRTGPNMETDRCAQAIRILAKHLYDGATGHHFKPQFGNERENNQILIYGVIAWGDLDEWQSLTDWSDRLKSSLPPGIKHMMCYIYRGGSFRSCSNTFDHDGAVSLRELRFSGDDVDFELRTDATKPTTKVRFRNGMSTNRSGPTSSTHLPAQLKRCSGLSQ